MAVAPLWDRRAAAVEGVGVFADWFYPQVSQGKLEQSRILDWEDIAVSSSASAGDSWQSRPYLLPACRFAASLRSAMPGIGP